MISTIRVISKGESDSKGDDLLAEIKRTLNIRSIEKIRTAKVYKLENISKSGLKEFAEKVLCELIDQEYTVDKPIIKGADKVIEVAYKPGVMNPEIASIKKAAKDLGIDLKAADSSYEYAFFGKLNEADSQKIIKRLLVNDTVEQIVRSQPTTLLISGKAGSTEIIKIREMTDKNLMNLSNDKLFLNLEEMKVIQNYFKKIKRDPTDCEIEVLAQTWSEHCGHKTFKAKLTIDGKQKE